MPNCNYCHKSFPDYNSLAIHIMAANKGHARGKKWASKYVLVNNLSAKNRREKNNSHLPLTEEQKESRRNLRDISLSGESQYVDIICPKCRKPSRMKLPIEYINSPDAWRTHNRLIKVCMSCGGKIE